MSIRIFTDGSSRGNPGPGGWGAIIDLGDRVVELGGRENRTTNNRMELTAALEALSWARSHSHRDATVFCDSKYVINGITSWIHGWQRNGWITSGKKEVENRDLWQALLAASAPLSLVWKHVDGHAGVPANERCDEIATSFADEEKVELYDGPAKLYGVDLSITAATAGAKAAKGAKKSSSKSQPAYSYLSLVDGALEKHATWAECEKRVKGVRGAKFKKSTSAEDEQAIIDEWMK